MHRVVSSHASKNINNVLDRHNLSQIKDRFLKLNQQRIQRAQSSLHERQRIFLDTLPLLFHTNHPMLPGYVGQEAPCGIRGFHPTKTDLLRGRSLAKSFTLKPYESIDERILGIYVMGSLGTIAQNNSSDIDIWLCCSQDITDQEKQQLSDKCEKITTWADTLSLEVHFFLMDCDVFRNGKVSDLDEESSGSAQHYLLLDEFYRTGIHIAGCYPLWWFVPSSQECEYDDIAKTLTQNHFIDPKSVLDFGPIVKIPVNEFFGAAIWQLYKAIESPYKSILKLFMLEAHFTQYQSAKPLSLIFKNQIYEGSSDINELDPYVMVYRSIDLYLESQGQADRLDIARFCFYYKVNKPLSQKRVRYKKSWQRQFLGQMVSQWGWSENVIAELDQRSQWKTKKVVAERNILISVLNGIYQNLCEGIDSTDVSRAISSNEINIIGRKLKAAFDRRPGKIERINPGLSMDLEENRVCLEKYDDGHICLWQMYADTPRQDDSALKKPQVLSRYGSLSELIAWACLNGVIDKGTLIDLPVLPSLGLKELNQLIKLLNSWLLDSLNNAPHVKFRKAAAPEKLLMLINSDVTLEEQFSDSYYDSDVDDVFNYGGSKKCLIQSIDLVEKNSWNEITVKRFEGEQAVPQSLEYYLSMIVPGSLIEAPPIEIFSVADRFGASIIRRLNMWFHEILSYHKNSRNGHAVRFVSRIANQYCALEFIRGRFYLHQIENMCDLMVYLGEPRNVYSELIIDNISIQNVLLREICLRNRSGSIEVYVESKKSFQQITICDERGSLICEKISKESFDKQFSALHRFIRNTVSRLKIHKLEDDFIDSRTSAENVSNTLVDDCMAVKYYEVVKNKMGKLEINNNPIYVDESQVGNCLQAFLYVDQMNEICYDFKFEQHSFSWAEWQSEIFTVVSQMVSASQKVKHGDSLEDADYIIDDIDVSACEHRLKSFGRMQLGQYLHLKHSIESRLRHSS